MNSRTDLLNHFIRERGFHSFLEIGTDDGADFVAHPEWMGFVE